MNRYRLFMIVLTACLFFSFSSGIYAHVSVYPKETSTNAYEKYTVRVPVEKEVSTTAVRLEFPAGVKVSTVMPAVGWSYEIAKDAEGRFTGITWKAVGEGIKPHEFMEFSFVGKNPEQATSLSWKAYQTYADGSVVEWTGSPDSDKPASVTTVNPGTGDQDHGHAAPTFSEKTGVMEPEETSSLLTNGTLPLILSALALLLSLISLFRKRA
ncbi:YcnI family copper-binding membrane protein [Brevibacillus migulae]|uniref:YcnI family copper-binding membrane protein n=1 Tax=Brevibacillus migulae TaxID=1644114 RepID=UPI00106E8CF3|nr:YcnI family protein [Brevibacillus migulae]